jgi:hypothetical protein
METAILDVVPETPGEELRFESAQRAVHIHRQARKIRMVVLVIVAVITAARIGLATSVGLNIGIEDAPVMYGVCLLATLLSISHEWSTRLLQEDRLEAYAQYLTSHR